MKKILAIFMMSIMCLSISAQTATNQKFLNRYDSLVARIQDKYADKTDSIAAWKAERKSIQTLYKEKYKAQFSDSELEKYYELNALYKSKMAKYQLNDLGTQADSIGNKVSKKAKRIGKAVNGFIKGLKKQSDSNKE